MKKLLALVLTTIVLAACEATPTTEETTGTPTAALGAIAVGMREEGSGSRGAFEEILRVNTSEEDLVTDAAVVGQGNGGIATFVSANDAAIGYVSFATLVSNESLFGISIDGVEPTHANVLNGTFSMARPFVVIYEEGNLTDLSEAFLVFMQSAEGAAELEAAGTIPNPSSTPFDIEAFSHLSGTLTLGGSTSVEASALALGRMFEALLPNVRVTYNSAGSGAGINGAQDGTYDLGFASRDLRDGELGGTANSFVMTMDGLAIVTNTVNPVADLTFDQLRAIYLGEITSWDELN